MILFAKKVHTTFCVVWNTSTELICHLPFVCCFFRLIFYAMLSKKTRLLRTIDLGRVRREGGSIDTICFCWDLRRALRSILIILDLCILLLYSFFQKLKSFIRLESDQNRSNWCSRLGSSGSLMYMNENNFWVEIQLCSNLAEGLVEGWSINSFLSWSKLMENQKLYRVPKNQS